MAICAKCQSPLGPSDRACGECGARVEAVTGGPPAKACPACHAPVGASDRVCGDCGARLGAVPAELGAGVCAACGAQRKPTERFCGECGASASISAATREAPPVATHATEPQARVLYVVPEAHVSALGSLLGRHGEVLSVAPDTALAQVQRRLASGTPLDAVCLLGGDHDLPMTRVEDPTEHDEALLTDNFFGCRRTPTQSERFTGDLLAEVPVSRIPTLDVVLISRLLADAAGLSPTWGDGFALSAAVWEGASRAVAELLFGAKGPPLQLSPPADEAAVQKALGARPGRLYFNVHGSGDEPRWVGQGQNNTYPAVLRPSYVSAADRAIVVSEACYGAMSFPDDGGGLGEHFLRAGAGAFVGSSIIAWGPPSAPPSGADLMVIGFYQALDEGHTAAAALLAAKRAMLDSVLVRRSTLAPADHNTLLSFVHLGAPQARVAGVRPVSLAPTDAAASFKASPTAPTAKQGGRESALDRIRSRMSGETASVTGSVRDRLSGRLSPADWQVLSSGRLALAQLPAEFRSYATITRSLETLLGAAPPSVHVLRFEAGAKRFSHVSAALPRTGSTVRAAALLLDDGDREIERWVSR